MKHIKQILKEMLGSLDEVLFTYSVAYIAVTIFGIGLYYHVIELSIHNIESAFELSAIMFVLSIIVSVYKKRVNRAKLTDESVK
jgi:Na+/proline symporter